MFNLRVFEYLVGRVRPSVASTPPHQQPPQLLRADKQVRSSSSQLYINVCKRFIYEID